MLLLGLDLETTGLSVKEDRIIEIGLVLWDTDRKKPLDMYNTMVAIEGQVTPEITGITGILNEDLQNHGINIQDALKVAIILAEKADAIVAHNGTSFDRPLFEAECSRNGLAPPVKHWIDTCVDVPYPPRVKTRSLAHLAAEHGFLNPFPHRALSDVLTMLKLLSYYDAEDVLRISKEPSVKVIALVKEPWKDTAPAGKKETDKAKARGFRFDGEKKHWAKIVKQSGLREEESHGEFLVMTREI
jgi:DNA polymerase-3 subunit epsilon